MPDIITLGETMAVVAPTRPGRLRNSSTLFLRAGGTESNVAVSLARLGVSSGWISALGRDELGDLVLATIRGEGVDCSRVTRSDAPTGLHLRDEIGGGAVRSFYYRTGVGGFADGARACGRRVPRRRQNPPSLRDHSLRCLPAARRSCTKWQLLLVSGVLLSTLSSISARNCGSSDQAKAAIEELLPHVDLFFVGDDEAELLWQASDEQFMRDLSGRGPAEVVMKRGARGARAFADQVLHASAAFRVPVVDTVGAGDAFAAGYLAAKAWDWPLSERLRYGNVMGAYCVIHLATMKIPQAARRLKHFLGSGKLWEDKLYRT